MTHCRLSKTNNELWDVTGPVRDSVRHQPVFTGVTAPPLWDPNSLSDLGSGVRGPPPPPSGPWGVQDSFQMYTNPKRSRQVIMKNTTTCSRHRSNRACPRWSVSVGDSGTVHWAIGYVVFWTRRSQRSNFIEVTTRGRKKSRGREGKGMSKEGERGGRLRKQGSGPLEKRLNHKRGLTEEGPGD